MKVPLSIVLKEFIGLISLKLLISIEYYHSFGKKMNWKNPTNINEKINWLKFYSDTSLWPILADKYAVRKYIKDKGLSNILVKLYAKYDTVSEIEWEQLPNQFVMKVNNGSGDILVCSDKSCLDKKSVSSTFDTLLNKTFSNYNGEPHYAVIKPCIIVEELLDCKKQPIVTNTLVDYKIWCFNGKPHHIWACYNRYQGSVEVAVYDLEWKRHDECSVFTSHYKQAKKELPRPKSLEQMLSIAAILSEGLPQVRVDLYEVDNRAYFGEMTLTSAGGFMNFYTDVFLEKMGDLVDLGLCLK